MPVTFALPFAVALAAVGMAVIAQRRLHPGLATQTLTLTSVAAAASWISMLLALVLGSLAEMPAIDRWLAWCPDLYRVGRHVSWSIGALAGAGLVASTCAVVGELRRTVRDHRRLPLCGSDGHLILDCDEPAAFAVPGRRGGIVVSRGLIESLDAGEQSVVWAHERAHLRNRHHWYLLTSALAASVLPVLRPIARLVHFGTERWADEESVRVTGDRHLVARAVAKAAIASTGHSHARMAMATSAVPARVEALVAPNRQLVSGLVGLAIAVPLMVLTLGGSTLQFHHLVALVEHVCGGA